MEVVRRLGRKASAPSFIKVGRIRNRVAMVRTGEDCARSRPYCAERSILPRVIPYAYVRLSVGLPLAGENDVGVRRWSSGRACSKKNLSS